MASSEKETMLPGMRALVHFWQQLSVSQWAVTVLVTLLAVLTPGPGWAGGSPDNSADAAAIIAPPTTTGTCSFIFAAEPQAHQLALRTIDPKTVVYSEADQCIIICLQGGFNAPIYDFAEAAGYAFDAYGVEIARSGTTSNRYGYCGYENVSSVGSTYLRARWYQSGVGRFPTMDTWEGEMGQPISLAKYLYVESSPISKFDPTGHQTLVEQQQTLTVDALIFTGAVIAAAPLFKDASEGLAYATAGAISAAESALIAVYRSVNNALNVARQALKKLNISGIPKIVAISRTIMPNVAAHIDAAQSGGSPVILTRTTPFQKNLNRKMALRKVTGSAGFLKSWDEYPFASSLQGGISASVVAVPAIENFIQGGTISACYFLERILIGNSYWVIFIP